MPADTVEVVVKLTGLGAVQAGMRQFRAAINGPLEAAATRIRGFALGLGSTFLAGLSVYRIGAELGKALTEMDRADEVSQKLGIAADELTALNFAATLADSSAEKLQNGLKFLARSVDEGAEAFTTLGIQLRNADGAFRPQREILEDIADRFAAMPDGIEKTALALKLFGKEGVSMIPLLNSGAAGIRAMTDEARAFGVVVAPEAAAGASLLNDNVSRLKMAVEGVARTTLAELLPTLLDVTNRLIEWLKANDAIRKAAGLLSEALRYLVFDIHALIVAGRIWWQTATVQSTAVSASFLALGRLLARVWEQPIEVLRALIDHLKVAVRAAGDLAGAVLLVVQGRFGEARDKAKAAGLELAGSVLTTGKAVVESAGKTGDALRDAFVIPIQGAAATFRTFIEEGKKGFEELRDAAGSLWSPPALPPVKPAGTGSDFDLDPVGERRKRIAYDLREAEYDLRQRRQLIADEMAKLEADFGTLEADKYRQRIGLLREEIILIDQEIERLRARLEVEQDADVREGLTQSMRGLESERHGVEGQLTRAEGAPDPYSMRDQMLATITELENRLGTAAESVARAFSGVIGTAIDGIANGIEGLVKGTMDWADALRSIGSSILNGVISAISRMFAEWIAKRALMAVKNMMFSTQEGATDAAAKAPGAMMSSISSYGVAAVVGMAAMLAALAAISGAFAKGGRPTPGMPALVGEEGPELFIPDRPGLIVPAGITERIMSAVSAPTESFYAGGENEPRPGFSPPSPSAGGSTANMSLVLVDNRKHAREFLESADGQALIVDVIRRRRMDIGLKT